MKIARKTMQKYFVPSEANNYKPHFLRRNALLITLFFVLVIELVFLSPLSFFGARMKYIASVLPGVLVAETNGSRLDSNLSLLTPNPVLQLAAQLKANDMATKGYFSHTSPDGHEPWYWLKQAGYSYQYAGENLAVNFVDSSDVTRAWLNSPSHRANIVNSRYTEIGIAVASGVYKGKNTMFVVQFFGAPRTTPIAQMPSEQAKKAPPSTPLNTPHASVQKMTQASVSTSAPVSASIQTQGVKDSVLGTGTEASAVTAISSGKLANDSLMKIIRRMLTEPKLVADYVFGAVMLLVLLSLTLAIFIKIKIQHPPMIAGAVALVVLVAGLMYFNTTIFSKKVVLPHDSASNSAAAAASVGGF